MNDDPRLPELDDRLLDAVSAVVDDVADADERALVAASPEAQRWVEHLRAQHDELAALAMVTPSADVREAAFAAALAVFDELQAPAPTATIPPHEHGLRTAAAGTVDRIVSLAEHRRRRSRWFMAAAAAVVVLAGVGIAVRGGRSHDEVADSAATAPVDGAASAKSAPAPMAAAVDTAAPAGAAPADASATQAAPEAADAASSGEAAAADTEAATEMEALPSTIGVIEVPADVSRAITSPDDLAAFVAGAIGVAAVPAATEAPAGTEAPAATAPPAPASTTMAPADTAVAAGGAASCTSLDQVVIGSISYLGTPAIAVYDPATSSALAYDAADCHLLATVPLD